MPRAQSWSTPWWLVCVGWLAAAAALAWCLLADDPESRVLAAVVVLVLAAAATHGSVCRPRLLVDAEGVQVRGLTGVRRWSWPDATVALRTTRRLGRTIRVIEVDAGDDLVVLTQLELGADPADVADAVAAGRA